MSTNTDVRLGRNLPFYFKKDITPGISFDSATYLAIIKDNRDSTRSGRLGVWIPDHGGDENDPSAWRYVYYASPFLGTTIQEDSTGFSSTENKFNKVKHSYGMWYNVPDIGNYVLCTFAAGDPGRGFWFACVNNQLGHHMVPAIGASDKIDTEKIDDDLVKNNIEDGQPYPVVEFNEYNKEVNFSNFTEQKKPIHEPQVRTLLEQGLDRYNLTKSRGIIKSTSQRETPSGVFGISTPGRPFGQAVPKITDYGEKRKVRARQGGHTFVLDDGDQEGKNNLTRWRSSGGHQILMDDDERIMYISNYNGSVWMEFTAAGHLSIYSSNSINVRTKKDFNLHVDGDFNLDVGGDIKVRAKKGINLEAKTLTSKTSEMTKLFAAELQLGADGKIDITTENNIGIRAEQKIKIYAEEQIDIEGDKPDKVEKPQDLPLKSLPDTEKENGKWQVREDKIKSVSKLVPTHEPWARKYGETSATSNNSAGDTTEDGSSMSDQPAAENTDSGSGADSAGGSAASGGAAGGVTRSLRPGEADASTKKISKVVPVSALQRENAPNPPDGIGTLTKQETKGLLTAIAYSESEGAGDYKAENQFGYVGRYQMGAAALVDSGYIHKDAYEQYKKSGNPNEALNHPSSWTGKGGVRSKDDFKTNPAAQEDAAYTTTSRNYNQLVRSGAITKDDDAGSVGGKLMTAHLLGAGGAAKWTKTGGGTDANGTSGTEYYNRGRDAVTRLGNVT